MDEQGVAPRGARGRIPDFIGSAEAAVRLAELPEWQSARVLKANPDRAQLLVRKAALGQGKLVFMAVPRLASLKPFFRLDPQQLTSSGVPVTDFASAKMAAEHASRVGVQDMPALDLIVCGTVAVNHEGVRIGKGAGYSDIEVGLLAEAGLITERTTIVTTVHGSQVLDEQLPRTEHDFTVDYVVTPDATIACENRCRPNKLIWENLSPAQIQQIPALTARTKG